MVGIKIRFSMELKHNEWSWSELLSDNVIPYSLMDHLVDEHKRSADIATIAEVYPHDGSYIMEATYTYNPDTHHCEMLFVNEMFPNKEER